MKQELSIALRLTVSAPMHYVGPETLPEAPAGQPYHFILQVEGGVPPLTFSAMSGMPPGLSLSLDGAISGTPTQPGDYSFDVKVSDSGEEDEPPAPPQAVSSFRGNQVSRGTAYGIRVPASSPLPPIAQQPARKPR